MRPNKQGSALLIVLGFLSFMVVSAVAFAIYMRAERMPSSALRRAIATRHLVKAALAEAISRVDDAIRDDPFPGFCATNSNGTVMDPSRFYYFRSGEGGNQAIDVWDGRVFMPPDPQGGTIDAETRYAPVTETVSVLTLEGLGYLPPPLVNDVRFLSRSSWAASWQQLPFDSGRFAYCAVNVSDYLDINCIPANKPRTAEPQCRLSLAHLFDRNFDPNDLGGGNTYNGSSVENPDVAAANIFDDFTGKRSGSLYTGYVAGDSVGGAYEKWDPIGGSSPYVSMLDYNLAFASAGPNSFMKPLYYNWLTDRRRDQSYYIQSSSRSSEMYDALRQPFVTDSWSTNETWDVDISTTDGQPFRGMQGQLKRTNGSTTPSEVAHLAAANTFFDKMESQAQLVGLADYLTLYDYLDHDDIPLSLAFPCVERVPMIAGLTPPQFTMTKFNSSGDDENKVWNFDPRQWFDDSKEMHVVIPFPFKRGEARGSSSFSAQALVRMVLAPAGADKSALAKVVRPKKETWQTPGRTMDGGAFSFTCLSNPKQFTVPDDVVEDSEAHASGNGVLSFTFGDFPNNLSSVDVLKKETIAAGGEGDTQKKKTVYTVFVSPLDDNGAPAFQVGTQLDEGDFDGRANIEYVPHVFVWVRILNSNQKTVDLVPAGLYDDQDLENRAVGPDLAEIAGLTGEASADAKPVFEFISTDQATSLSFAKMRDGSFGGGDAVWNVKGIYAVDPRFNYAPEHWYDANTENITFDDWLQKTKSALQALTDRDPDIFMFTSNQGVLQSIGEFGFLPYLHEPGTSSSFSFTEINRMGLGSFGADARTVMTTFGYLWRTYDPRDFYTRSAQFRIGRSHQKDSLVNPHTDNLGVMMAALANTPYDYWAAAAGVDKATSQLYNDLGNSSSEEFTKFADAKDFAFNGANSGAKIQYKELVQIAKTIMGAMGGASLKSDDAALQIIQSVFSGVQAQSLRVDIAKLLKERIRNGNGAIRPSNTWQLIWDELWGALAFDSVEPTNSGSFEELLGVRLSEPLHYVDRKFLYSYWRDCFANNQQLFLIFVRAESSALGGPGEGTPAQLGGRAVALVWRDPDWSEGNGDSGRDRDIETQNNGNVNRMRPHRTRVLFYHQFD
ncbi:MAG: hypothetical protein ACI4RA_09575 [Kiritimatiellia bacterium]